MLPARTEFEKNLNFLIQKIFWLKWFSVYLIIFFNQEKNFIVERLSIIIFRYILIHWITCNGFCFCFWKEYVNILTNPYAMSKGMTRGELTRIEWFSFFYTSCLSKAKESSLPHYLRITGMKRKKTYIRTFPIVSTKCVSVCVCVCVCEWMYAIFYVYICIANGPGDMSSIPDHVIPKTLKMVLDTSLLNTQQYKVHIKGKVEQFR